MLSETFLFMEYDFWQNKSVSSFPMLYLVLDVPLGLLALHAEFASEVNLVAGSHLDCPEEYHHCHYHSPLSWLYWKIVSHSLIDNYWTIALPKSICVFQKCLWSRLTCPPAPRSIPLFPEKSTFCQTWSESEPDQIQEKVSDRLQSGVFTLQHTNYLFL